ncbi:CHAD domain-containing protein [Funiculus sociatus GB2-A5]|uniref:CHAD domain-containing protein n=1 Tax=Funiculus sociatus GB2-A5 TaxID=2933946 RepID=A0ABV0JVF9_9CYAN|nr:MULTISPECIES: CHAD domain-containing protein [unclassified Trichocoleus]MBD1904110.1 CHAD domain-containing protein [Trichocoleus sp. FACHB-832]MBD2063381.1 CHAD domain-containing protein [Trichocoleus sp. FACHB-6]
MKKSALEKAQNLGDWAYLAIEKHFHKTLKHESDVIKDKDPEALHQMRVGMRRLRSAITGFAPALDLPKSAQENKIGKIGHSLGELRDIDVLQEALKNRYYPNLPSKEQKTLEEAIASLNKQRHHALEQVRQTLDHQRYQKLKQSFQTWLKHPSYQEIAQMPLRQVLPDLLSPEISRFFLHPGWLLGTDVKAPEIKIAKDLEPEAVTQLLADQGEVLHSLRKEAKRVRYQMELFTDLYGPAYAGYLQDVKSIQEILGEIQDSAVLAEVLTDILDSKVKNQLPTLAEQLHQTAYQAWQQWQPLQERYLNAQTRQAFHLALLQRLDENDSPDEEG